MPRPIDPRTKRRDFSKYGPDKIKKDCATIIFFMEEGWSTYVCLKKAKVNVEYYYFLRKTQSAFDKYILEKQKEKAELRVYK